MNLEGLVFVPVPRYEGYYWCVKTQTLFSIKNRKGKPPRELCLQVPSNYNRIDKKGYGITHEARYIFLTLNWLKTLNREPCVQLVLPSNHFEDKELFRI